MNIALVGGGSGGHITPLLAVAHELKRIQPDTRLAYIGEKGGKFAHVIEKSGIFNERYEVAAGKLRRYPGSKAKQILDVPTNARNSRDAVRVARGTLQARRLLKKLQPDGIFFAGGFVGVPIGIAAHRLNIPYITFDLDAAPGLANRIIGRWASVRATGMPIEFYDYPKASTVFVGVPVANEYQPLTPDSRAGYRRSLGVADASHVVTIIGGSQGAARLNTAASRAVSDVLAELPGAAVFHISGAAHETAIRKEYEQAMGLEKASQVRVAGFVSDLYRYTGAADVVITRAGANSIAELAAQHQAAIVVPSAELANGHQIKNAGYLKDHQAAVVYSEKELEREPAVLSGALSDLLHDPPRRDVLGDALAGLARDDAAHHIATLLLDTFNKDRS